MLGTAQSLDLSIAPTEVPRDSDPREMSRIALDGSSIEIDVMIYRRQLTELQPLVIVNSLEMPMPPSQAFCDKMWHQGYQVIFIRRPGFGGAPGLPLALLSPAEVKNGAAVITEAALLKRLITTLGLSNIILLGLGTANSVCVRLSKLSPEIQLSVLSNPLFHQDVWDIVRPRWMQSMMRQTLTSTAGLKITVMGLKSTLNHSPLWFFRQFGQKSAGDIEYVRENSADFIQASQLMQSISHLTVYYDVQMALVLDTNVDANFFRDVNAVFLCGEETTEVWKQQIQDQASRFEIPLVFAPSGDLFVPYRSPEVLLKILDTHQAQSVAAS